MQVVILIVGSMVGANAAVVGASGLKIIGAVALLHSCGFGLGYGLSKSLGLSNKIARTNSIGTDGACACLLSGTLRYKPVLFAQPPHARHKRMAL